MPVSLEPGYDFTTMEEVTSDKLRIWVGGIHNTATLSGGDVGMVAYDLDTNPTWSSCLTEGNLCYNTTRGWIEVRGQNGWVPLMGTQGGLFTMRVPEIHLPNAGDTEYYHGAHYKFHMVGYNGYESATKVLPVSCFSAGIGFDNFGFPLDDTLLRTHISVKWEANHTAPCRWGSAACKYPSHNQYNPTGALTNPAAVSSGSNIFPLYQVAGIMPLGTYITPAQSAVTNTYLATHAAGVVNINHAVPPYPTQMMLLSESITSKLNIAPFMSSFDGYNYHSSTAAHDFF
jgi:hypothetical protein